MELAKQELQYLIGAIDTHIRANGVASAAQGALLAKKFQDEFNRLLPVVKTNGDNGDQ